MWGIQGGQTTNCLLYDTDLMRTTLFTFAGICIVVSTLLDIGVWYYSADINIFEEDELDEEMKSETMQYAN